MVKEGHQVLHACVLSCGSEPVFLWDDFADCWFADILVRGTLDEHKDFGEEKQARKKRLKDGRSLGHRGQEQWEKCARAVMEPSQPTGAQPFVSNDAAENMDVEAASRDFASDDWMQPAGDPIPVTVEEDPFARLREDDTASYMLKHVVDWMLDMYDRRYSLLVGGDGGS